MKIFISLLIIFGSVATQASSLSAFFNSKAGNWDLVSGWSRSINEDGSTGDEWVRTLHKMQISNQGDTWKIYEDFCSESNGTALCGQALPLYQIIEDQLFFVDEMTGSKQLVEIYRSTPNELSFRLDQNGLIFTFTEHISTDGVLTRVTQTEIDGRILEISFLSSKRSTR